MASCISFILGIVIGIVTGLLIGSVLTLEKFTKYPDYTEFRDNYTDSH